MQIEKTPEWKWRKHLHQFDNTCCKYSKRNQKKSIASCTDHKGFFLTGPPQVVKVGKLALNVVLNYRIHCTMWTMTDSMPKITFRFTIYFFSMYIQHRGKLSTLALAILYVKPPCQISWSRPILFWNVKMWNMFLHFYLPGQTENYKKKWIEWRVFQLRPLDLCSAVRGYWEF